MEGGNGATILVVITFIAAGINSAVGYGFSSITVPVALLFYANRTLNPGVVLIECFISLYVLAINRTSVSLIWKRLYPIVLGLVPGITVGSYLLTSIPQPWFRLSTYILLLPLILLQAAGIRRPVRFEKLIGLPFGMGLGLLYSATTISGPPLALLFNNQGMTKHDFSTGLALVRAVESALTAVAYYRLGLFTAVTRGVTAMILPGVAAGIPIGAYLIRYVNAEAFRRISISFNVWTVGFGLARALIDLKIVAGPAAYWPLVLAIILDMGLVYLFPRGQHRDKSTVIK